MSTRVICCCGQAFAAAPELAGTTVRCPVCGAGIEIPFVDPLVRASGRQRSSPNFVVWAAVAAGGFVLLLVLAIVGRTLVSDQGPQPQAARQPGMRPPQPPSLAPSPGNEGLPPPVPLPTIDSEETTVVRPGSFDDARRDPPARPGSLVIGPGMYEITAPGAKPVEGTELTSSAGLTISGGAILTSDLTPREALAKIEELRARTSPSLANVIVSWALIIKARPQEPAPNKNPSAKPITVDGLSGIEIRGPGGQVTWAFGFTDHSLILSARGPAERVHSAEVQAVLSSLRRTGDVPPELAEQAKSSSGR